MKPDYKRTTYISLAVAVLSLLVTGVVLAGNMDSPGAPTAAGSQMYTLAQIYNRLTTGAEDTKMTAFTEPSSGPGSTMNTLDEIMAVAPVLDNTNGATDTHVLADQTFWGLNSGQWATQTGTMPNNGAVNIAPGTTVQTIAAGYHNGSGTVQGDPDLIAGNIKSGVNLFGVDGSLVAGVILLEMVPKTGQTTCYDVNGTVISCAGTGQDGEYQLGIEPALAPSSGLSGAYLVPAWTGTRFTDNGDGTVRDNMTGLIWLKSANCWGVRKTWATALSNANGLASGSCGLSDGSSAGDWRLPNVNELRSLIDLTQSYPALPGGHPFTRVQSNIYWSSTTYAPDPAVAWFVYLSDGLVYVDNKASTYYVWPVRGGQ